MAAVLSLPSPEEPDWLPSAAPERPLPDPPAYVSAVPVGDKLAMEVMTVVPLGRLLVIRMADGVEEAAAWVPDTALLTDADAALAAFALAAEAADWEREEA